MPQLGPLEMIVVCAVALIVFGPQKLPEIARSVGRTLAELRRQASEIRSDFTSSLDQEDGESPAAGPPPSGPQMPDKRRPTAVEADSQEP